MSHTLMEDAAAVLSGSKKSAPSQPMQTLPGEKEDLGGPTPQDYTNDPNGTAKLKINPKDTSKQNQASIAMKPSNASVKEASDYENDITAMFSEDTLSEEFKTKAATIFEARVLDRVTSIQEALETEYASMLEEAVQEIKDDLVQKIDDYMSYVVEQWLEDNQIAIESSLRSELTEDFIVGLRNLFAEHYIDVPTEKVDLVNELASKIEVLETKLNEEIQHGINLRKSLIESKKIEIVHSICEGLTATQVEKIKKLAESIDYSTEEEYIQKLETIRENYYPTEVKKVQETHLNEQWEDTSKVDINDPFVAAVSQAISKTKI